MKKVIFIGKSGCGKTSLCQRLQGEEIKYKKTQSIDLYVDSIDTPGEYLENRNYYSALITTAAEANIIALVQECGDTISMMPPGFAGTFGREVIGIITKTDIGECEDSIDIIEEQLRVAGVSRVFKVSAYSTEGIEELKRYVDGL
ncbi:EutP/PduV family microcompartment system protein [Clostridium sp. NSJ-49]|uniref:EutP/PduV family microcompartment system protein n=1 Tax=Clostridium TaxID=1485 RepID=UPI00164ADD01|nr:EutP/PduV family microcompartment system protein [Clostridium sp. NSJ-49]MBC5624085.1 EutP/PduV family microcompartment system protein [Clostridium sp. NSJ-49]